MHLRAAQPMDAGQVGAILTEFTHTTDWVPHLHSGAEDIAHAGVMIERGWVTVVETGGAVVGFAACNGGDLDALYVSAQARRQGIGTALMKHLKSQHNQLALWTFEQNAAAQQFYCKHGFEELSRTDGSGNDEGLPDIKYGWTRKAKT